MADYRPIFYQITFYQYRKWCLQQHRLLLSGQPQLPLRQLPPLLQLLLLLLLLQPLRPPHLLLYSQQPYRLLPPLRLLPY
jgi:hypothetical protein